MNQDGVFLHDSGDPFDTRFIGTFGRFYLQDSIEVDYMLTSISVDDLNSLQTAADAFDFNDIGFEEMMQRDVDYDRVNNEIVSNYLLKSSGSVIFFPPIIVSVVAVGPDNRPFKDPMNRSEIDRDGKAVFQWGEDKFEVCLPKSDKPTGYVVKFKGNDVNFHHYATVLRTNSKRVRLVVIDGQHRFVALQQLLKTKPDQIKLLELPVCFVFSPNAMEGVGDTDVIRAFRNMFVTINNEAKKVSGHFITLLRDKSLAATAIRCIAEKWKTTSSDSANSFLHMLEWNEREDSWANRRTKTYSITTVGILEIALTRLFSRAADVRLILDLPSRREDLEHAQKHTPYASIKESEFDVSQLPIIKDQIDKTVAPAITSLYRHGRPYLQQWKRFEDAVSFLDAQIELGIRGYSAYKSDVLMKFRKTNVLDDDTVTTAEGRFSDRFEIPENDEIYFLNVFQQGLIRVWGELCSRIAPLYEIEREKVAIALAAALNEFCFAYGDELFNRDRVFVRYTLFQDGGKPQLSDVGRTAWKSYIASTLGNVRSMTKLNSWIESAFDEPETIKGIIGKYLIDERDSYLGELRRRLESYVASNFEFGPFDQEKRDELLELRAKKDANSENAELFDRKLQELSEDYFLQTKKKWLAAIEM